MCTISLVPFFKYHLIVWAGMRTVDLINVNCEVTMTPQICIGTNNPGPSCCLLSPELHWKSQFFTFTIYRLV